MEQKLRVIVADHDLKNAYQLKVFLEEKSEIGEVRAISDGEKAYEMIAQIKPDVAILDTFLPSMNGVEVLKKLRMQKAAQNTAFIFLSSVSTDELVGSVAKLNAAYFLMRPYQEESIYKRIVKCTTSERMTTMEEADLESSVTQLIRELGIPAHIKGYHYIRESIILAVNDVDILNYITKLLYPTIAKKYKTTSSSVERAMRHAIEVAFSRGQIEMLEELFGRYRYSSKRKPTNSEFIAHIVDRLRLEQKQSIV